MGHSKGTLPFSANGVAERMAPDEKGSVPFECLFRILRGSRPA
jgi:hypothetical protein